MHPVRGRLLLAGLAVALLVLGSQAFGAVDEASDEAWIDDLDPLPASEWSFERAAHLAERAGFGATPKEIEKLAAMTPAQAVSRLVEYESIDASDLPVFDDSQIFDPGMDPFPPSRAEAVRIARENGRALGVEVLPEGESRRLQPVVDKFFYGLRADVAENRRLALWWADRMVATPRPLEEKLTFFWHGHFATSDVKVRDYRLMHAQNLMLRERASGSFRDLLLGIMRDPAMLVYLDNGENVKGHPNENFGREVLELFTMGVGNYTETDIREASRAFTGWTNDVLEFHFDPALHDDGEKTIFGKTGKFGGEEVVDLILAHPATAEFIAAKIYRFFVRNELSGELRAELGRAFRDSGYQVKPLLATIFLSRDFYSPPSVGTQIKSPVQLRRFDVSQARCRPRGDGARLQRVDRQAGSVAALSSERRGLGGRAHLDHPGDAARSRQHHALGALSAVARSVRPSRPSHARHLPGRGSATGSGAEYHRRHGGRRQAVEHDGGRRRGLQHALRWVSRLCDGLRAGKARASTSARCRSHGSGHRCGRHECGRGRRPPAAAFSEVCRWRVGAWRRWSPISTGSSAPTVSLQTSPKRKRPCDRSCICFSARPNTNWGDCDE